MDLIRHERLLASTGSSEDAPLQRRLQPGWVALAAALADLLGDPHHSPMGKTSFRRLAYFLTVAGVPTGLDFQRGRYGPYAADLTRVISMLVKNDLLEESRQGPRIELKLGGTFPAARVAYESNLDAWHEPIHKAADLLARMQTREAEVAATVHLVASEATDSTGAPPTDEVILTEVMDWKHRKRSPLGEAEVLSAIHNLAMLGWLEVTPSEHMRIEEAALVGF